MVLTWLGIGSANVWNPIGWAALAIGIGSWGLSFLFRDKETVLQRKKSQAARQLREQVDRLETELANELGNWFEECVVAALDQARLDIHTLLESLTALGELLLETSRAVRDETNCLHRRLLVGTARQLGIDMQAKDILRLARDPGICTKALARSTELYHDLEQVGQVLGEQVHCINSGPLQQCIADALVPAKIAPEDILVDDATRQNIVRVEAEELERALGPNGSNAVLVSELFDFEVQVEAVGSHYG
jgi:hypothetical protein